MVCESSVPINKLIVTKTFIMKTFINHLNTFFFAGLVVNNREDLVKGFEHNPRKIFSSADLWNIQRRKKPVTVK